MEKIALKKKSYIYLKHSFSIWIENAVLKKKSMATSVGFLSTS